MFDGALKFGWNVTGGGRSLFFNQAGDSAWYLDLGLGYTYTRGTDRVINVFSPRETISDPNSPDFGQLAGPDGIHPFRVRSLHRTTFNYALGRFWWLNGPGYLPAEADFAIETLSFAQGIDLDRPPAHLAFADRLDVVGWWPRRVAT